MILYRESTNKLINQIQSKEIDNMYKSCISYFYK